MFLSEGKENFEYKICGFSDLIDKQRFISLGFFINSKIKVVKSSRKMKVVLVSNTIYALNMQLAEKVIIK